MSEAHGQLLEEDLAQRTGWVPTGGLPDCTCAGCKVRPMFSESELQQNDLKRSTEQLSLPGHNLCFPMDSLQGDEKIKFCDSTFTCLPPSLFLTRRLCWPHSTLSLKPDSGLTTLQRPFSAPLPPASLNTRQHALGTCTLRRHQMCDFACADALIWKRTLSFGVSGGREGIGKGSP